MLNSKELIEHCLKRRQKQFDLTRCIQALMIARGEITGKKLYTQEVRIDALLEDYTAQLEGLSGLYN